MHMYRAERPVADTPGRVGFCLMRTDGVSLQGGNDTRPETTNVSGREGVPVMGGG